ncbi:hypothetical protein [Marivita sp. S0852]
MSLLLTMNWDRLLYGFAIVAALFLGAFIGSFVIEAMTHPVGY